MNVQLVEKGLARLNTLAPLPSSIRSQLEDAEEQARLGRIGLWSSEDFEELSSELSRKAKLQEDADVEIPACSVSHCNSVDDFYIQELPLSKMKELQTMISSHVGNFPSGGYSETPKVGEVVLARFAEDQKVRKN